MATATLAGPSFGGGRFTSTIDHSDLTGLFSSYSWTNTGGAGTISVTDPILGTFAHSFGVGESGNFAFAQPLDLLAGSFSVAWSAE